MLRSKTIGAFSRLKCADPVELDDIESLRSGPIDISFSINSVPVVPDVVGLADTGVLSEGGTGELALDF